MAIALASPGGGVAQSPAWTLIWDEPGIALIYVDRGSIGTVGTVRPITTRTVYRAPFPNGIIVERLRTEEADCGTGRLRLRYVKIFTSDGRDPQEGRLAPDQATWSAPPEPDTLGAVKLALACGTASPT